MNFTAKLFLTYALLFFTSVLTACDCHTEIEGRIYSSTNGLPIEGATIMLLGTNKIVKSDQLGGYNLTYISGFCPDRELIISKEGYKPFQIKLDNSNDHKIYTVKSETKSVDFETPVYPDSTNPNTYVTGSWVNLYSENFRVNSDSLIIYLDVKNDDQEIQNIKEKLKN